MLQYNHLTPRDLLRIRKRTVLRHRSDRSAGMRVFLGFSARNRDGDALHEINETLERKDINDKHKAMILGENAKRFYKSLVRDSPCCIEEASQVTKNNCQPVSNSVVATQDRTLRLLLVSEYR